MADNQSRKLSVKIDVDVSEALTGLKALQRESRKATQAIAELDAQYSPRIDAANDLLRIQGTDGNWNYDAYMHGMYNGMEIVLATIEGREPSFRETPVFISDISPQPKHVKGGADE